MVKKFASLDSSGWVTGLEKKADRALVYLFLADGLQSISHMGYVLSIPSIIYREGVQGNALVRRLEQELGEYFRNLFSVASVEVTVQYEDVSRPNEGPLDLRINLNLQDNLESVSIAKVARLEDGAFSKFLDISNYGIFR